MSDRPAKPSKNRPEPGSKEARLSDALRANLQRRKAAARKSRAEEDGTTKAK